MQLPDIQRYFAAYALRGEGSMQVSTLVKDNGLSAEQRLSVYRNNTQLGLTEALRDGYPVIDKLIGTACFNQLARDYIRQHPPTVGCLLSFGESFAAFIADYQILKTLPYLVDVARLEWFWQETFHEAEAKALRMNDLAQVAPEQYPDLSLQLLPSTRLLASSYPVLPIWQSNQEHYEGDGLIDLNQGNSCYVLIFRPALEVLIFPLSAGEFQFFSCLQQGQTLIGAAVEAAKKDSGFNLTDVLQRWFSCGLFTGIFIIHKNFEEIAS
jgi:hypothetical protein